MTILTGENGVFSAGGDITAWGELSPDQFSNTWLREGNRAFDALAQLRQPLLAVEWFDIWRGLELAACADLRIAEDSYARTARNFDWGCCRLVWNTTPCQEV